MVSPYLFFAVHVYSPWSSGNTSTITSVLSPLLKSIVIWKSALFMISLPSWYQRMRGAGNPRNLTLSSIRSPSRMVTGCSSSVNSGGTILSSGNSSSLALGAVSSSDMAYFGMVVSLTLSGFSSGISNSTLLVAKTLWKWLLYFSSYYECSKFKTAFKCLVTYVWYWAWSCMWPLLFHFPLHKCTLHHPLDEDDQWSA